jgi:hypothetical protein
MHSSNILQVLTRGLVACGVVVCLLGSGRVAHAQGLSNDSGQLPNDSGQLRRVQQLSDRLRVSLDIVEPVRVTLVPVNSLLMSVEPVENGSRREFRLKVEEEFVKGLSDAELVAAVAHELGHVWIFTHHPFLHTEQLANDIAMRLVSRDALTHLYERVWGRRGTTGDLARFLGPQPQAGLASSDGSQPVAPR